MYKVIWEQESYSGELVKVFDDLKKAFEYFSFLSECEDVNELKLEIRGNKNGK